MTGPSGDPTDTAVAGDSGSDLIQLRGLRTVGTHGVLPEEQSRAQPFEIDLDLAVDLGPAGRSDVLADTVDYAGVAAAAAAIVAGPPSFRLLEAVAGAVADATISADPRITSVTVSLRKLHPPLAVDISTVGVRITRHR